MSRIMRHAPAIGYSAETFQRKYPKNIYTLVSLLCLYLAAPLYDVPLLGLSLSAPLLFLLILQVQTRYGGIRFRRLGMLPRLLAPIWAGQLLSFFVNQLINDQQPEIIVGMITLLRYAYWFIVACVSAQLFLDGELTKRATRVFGYGCMAMAAFVLFEYLVQGGLLETGLSAITTLSQNTYGWQFSAFVPFVVYLAVTLKGQKKILAGIGLSMVLIAVIINGSRSSWGTVLIGMALLSFFWLVNNPGVRKSISLILLVALFITTVAGVFFVVPEITKEKVYNRIDKSRNLERDKSWLIRQLMIQKGERLFLDNPFLGVGPGQFRYVSTELDIPNALSYEGEDYFNKKSAHNSYILLLAEGGLATAIPFASILLWIIIAGFRSTIALAKRGETWLIPIYTGVICSSIHFWSLSGITSTAPWFLYGMMVATILRARTIEKYALATKRTKQYGTSTRISLPHPR